MLFHIFMMLYIFIQTATFADAFALMNPSFFRNVDKADEAVAALATSSALFYAGLAVGEVYGYLD